MTKAIGEELKPEDVQELLDGGWLEIVYVRSEKSGEVYVTLRHPQGQSLPAKPLSDNLIKAEDLTVSLIPLHPLGGQHAGTPPADLELLHTPSGLRARVNGRGSQHRAKQVAIDMIIGGLTSPHYRG